MLQISAADILKIVLPTVITLFIAVVKTPFRIRRENRDKLLNLLESIEKRQSAPIRLLRFRDYLGNSSAGLTALQLLLALPDSVAALERYRFTGRWNVIASPVAASKSCAPRPRASFCGQAPITLSNVSCFRVAIFCCICCSSRCWYYSPR